MERDLILEKMKLVPAWNVTAYLRKIAIDGCITQIGHVDIKAMIAKIQEIDVSVNQIARHVNATGNAYQEDIEETREVLVEMQRLQGLSLLKALQTGPLTISKTRARRTGKYLCPLSVAPMK